MERTAIYPGTFDPITNGHADLVHRAAACFDRVIIAVAGSTGKATRFSLDERVALAREVMRAMGNVEIESFDGLLVDFARKRGAQVILRGLRAVSDFESRVPAREHEPQARTRHRDDVPHPRRGLYLHLLEPRARDRRPRR